LSRTRRLFKELSGLVTEQLNPSTTGLDRMSLREILSAMNREDRGVARAVEAVLPQVERACELVIDAFLKGGRLIYVGAGTSGRMGVLDAAENPPTFGVPRTRVQGVIAGGWKALRQSIEGAEDLPGEGELAIEKKKVTSRDVVMGIAASRRTPFVLGALRKARSLGARTVFLVCNPPQGKGPKVDVVIAPIVGPEILSGSTRLKAATAQKMILNMVTTAAMVGTGKTYGNLMVDLRCYSEKLTERAKRIIMQASGADYARASRALEAAGRDTKVAIVMLIAGVGVDEARRRLRRHGGFVRAAIGDRTG